MNLESESGFIASFAIGLVGFGIFLYGKKQRRPAQLAVGVAMMIYPYFVSNTLAMIAIAAALVAALLLAVRAGL